MRTGLLILAGSFMLLAVVNRTEAATITWTNTAGGNWSEAANWDPNTVPGSGDDAVVIAVGSYTVRIQQAVSINSLILGEAGSTPTLSIEGVSASSASLTLAAGFTNNASVELTNTNANRSATLTVNGGPMVNSASGTLAVSTGAGGGSRTLAAELDNRGTFTVDYPLALSKSGSIHTNSGSIAVGSDINLTIYNGSFGNGGSMTFSGGAGLDINGNGTGASTFTTAGTLDMGTGIMDVDNCTFNLGSAITGSGTQDYSSVVLNLTSDLSNSGMEILMFNSTVNGPGALINAVGKSILLSQITCNADFVNEGELVCRRTVNINSGFDSPAGSSVRVEGAGSYSGSLILADSFTNNSLLELTNTNANRNATLTVNGGPLVNGAAGTLLVSAGAGGGSRTITAALDNRGTFTVGHPLTLTRSGAAHTNSGTITVSADLTLTLTNAEFGNSADMTFSGGAGLNINGNGSSASTFTTTGTMDLGTGLLDVNSCTFNYGGSVAGSGTHDYSSVVLNLTPDLSNAGLEILFFNSTINGPGTLTNASGESILFSQITCNADFVNEGELVCRRTVSLNGGFDNTGSATIRVEGAGAYSGSLTLANSFTNNSLLELTNTNANRSATLTVNGGPLVNDAAGTLLVSAGAGGGSRTLNAELDNRGTFTVEHPLTLTRSGAAHTNSGLVAASGDLTLTLTNAEFGNSGDMNFSGATGLTISGNGSSAAAFTTTGTLDMGTGLLDVNSCTFNYGGSVTGSGTQDYSAVVLNLTPDLSNAGLEILFYNSTINGPGTLINAAGKSMLLSVITCNADMVNQGSLVCRRTVSLNGGFDNVGSATIRVEGAGPYSGNLVMANSFTNNSLLELTNIDANRNATLTVNGGPLVNNPSGTLLASPGPGRVPARSMPNSTTAEPSPPTIRSH
jgi:hypothetical protein